MHVIFAADKTMVSQLSYLQQIHHHSSGYLMCVFAVFSNQSDRTGGILLSYAHSTGLQDVEEHLLPTFGLFLFSCNCDLTLFQNSNQCLAPRELLPLTEMSQWCFSPVVLQDTSCFCCCSSLLCLLQDKKVSQLHSLLLGIGLQKIDTNQLGNVQCWWHKLMAQTFFCFRGTFHQYESWCPFQS